MVEGIFIELNISLHFWEGALASPLPYPPLSVFLVLKKDDLAKRVFEYHSLNGTFKEVIAFGPPARFQKSFRERPKSTPLFGIHCHIHLVYIFIYFDILVIYSDIHIQLQ